MTYCSLCQQPLPEEVVGDELADKFIYKCGELAYIELAHIECAKTADNSDMWRF